MPGQSSGLSSPRESKEKSSYRRMSADTFGTAPTFTLIRAFRFLSVGTFKTPTVFSSNLN